jgi:hypothetical protein
MADASWAAHLRLNSSEKQNISARRRSQNDATMPSARVSLSPCQERPTLRRVACALAALGFRHRCKSFLGAGLFHGDRCRDRVASTFLEKSLSISGLLAAEPGSCSIPSTRRLRRRTAS